MLVEEHCLMVRIMQAGNGIVGTFDVCLEMVNNVWASVSKEDMLKVF